jgi:hypothetical protein
LANRKRGVIMANNFPNLLPSLNIDMCNGIYVDPRITFTRAGTRTYYGREMVKAEENLLLRSQEFDNVTEWGVAAGAVTRTANTTVAPDGTTTADTVAETSTTNGFGLRATVALAANTAYTISCYIKDITVRYVGLSVFGALSNYCYAEFDLTGGVLNRSGALGTGWSVTSTSITLDNEGFYRVVLVVTTGTSVSVPRSGVFLSDGVGAIATNGLPSYTGTTNSAAFWGAQLEQRSFATAYTATTTQPITRYQRLLKTAAANEWPREFDPVTGECLGRSVWESRTNLLLRSEEFDNASWTKVNSTISANQIIAPDGVLTADKLVGNSGVHTACGCLQSLAYSAGVNYAFSIYVKAAGARYVAIAQAYIDNNIVYLDLQTGTIGTPAGIASNKSASIVSIGNGWFRCTLVGAPTTTGGSFRVYIADALGSLAYTGDGYSGIYIWGAMLESGAFASPYIKTEAAQVTRLADSAVMTGVNFSSWFNPSEGTLFAEGVSYGGTQAGYAAISDGTTINEISIRIASAVRRSFVVAVTDQANISNGAYLAGDVEKRSISYAFNNVNAAAQGSIGTQDTVAVLPVVSRLTVGALGGGAQILNGYSRRLTYYPQALTSANLQAVTR